MSDIVIVGAGCAGLSAAVHLVESGCRRPITLIDPRTRFDRDRTWCFWRVHSHPFEHCVSHSWSRWRVRGPLGNIEQASERYPYQHIAADDFYHSALERLKRHDQVELRLGEKVTRVMNVDGRLHVATERDLLDAALVLDSRRPPPQPPAAHDIVLHQHFRGYFIRTRNDIFDPDSLVLMYFQPSGEHDGVHFIYLLPFSPRHALIESTWISEEKQFADATYDHAIRSYLDRHLTKGGFYSIYASERGVIPMSTAAMPASSPGIVRIGVAAGMARPSTGYAFLAIQRHSAALAAAIMAGERPTASPYTPRSAMLDQIFLSYLSRHWRRGPELFSRLFTNPRVESVIRFLSGVGSERDDLSAALTMPFFPFLLQGFRTTTKRWTA
ncbi:MAG: lycopene cyclase family protein [Acidobacteriota bacterium]